MFGICKQFQKGFVQSVVIGSGVVSGADAQLNFSDHDFIKFDDPDDAVDFSDILSDYFTDDFFVVEV